MGWGGGGGPESTRAMTQTLLRALAGQLERGGSAGAADGDYVGLGCGELDHVAQSNGPLRGGGKNGRGRRPNTCDALFSALLRRPSIRPRTFPSSLPHPSCLPSTFSSSHLLLLPSPRSSLRPLPQPPPPTIRLNPSVLYVVRPSQPLTPLFPVRLPSS